MDYFCRRRLHRAIQGCVCPSGESDMQPATHYAKSGDVHVAYQVFGEGRDLVITPGFVYHIENYWDGLLAVLDHAVDEGFVRAENSQLVLVAQTPGWMVERLLEWTPPDHIEKWLGGAER